MKINYSNEEFLKEHPVLALASAPLVGLVFAVFLPFIGIAMTVKFVGEKLYGVASKLAVQSYSMGWKPLEAYFIGKKKK